MLPALLFVLALPAVAPAQDPPAATANAAGAEQPPVRSETGDWIRDHLPAEWMKNSTFLLENWQWVGLLGLALLGIILDRIVVLILRGIAAQVVKRQGGELEAAVLRKGVRPFGYLAMSVLWWLAHPILNLEGQAREIIEFAVTLVMVSGVVWGLYRLVDIGSAVSEAKAKLTETTFDDLLIPLVRKAVKVFIVAFGLVFIADNLDIDISSMLAGLGIGGLALALAAKDTVSNLFGSMTVLLDKPFSVGDWVVIDGTEGTVEEINFRSTRIRTFYNSQISMPNSKLITAIVDNYGRRKYKRWSTKLGVAYETPPEKIEALCEGVRELVYRHPYTRKDYFHVYVNSFGDSAVEILLYIFHEVPDWGTELRERHRLMLDILRLCDRLGIVIAYPTQMVYHAADPGLSEPAPHPEKREIDGAAALGRKEAQAIAAGGLGGEGVQPPPVTYNLAERENRGEEGAGE
jgi:MscS family membrane protein